jgi:hypothetical protein
MQLAFFSLEGQSLEQIAAGVPFQLAVTIPDCKTTSIRPEIAGLEQFAVRSSGFSMATVNGVSTTKFLYTLSCDTPGTYRVGPARITMNGSTMQTKQASIVVGERTVPEHANSQVPEHKEHPYFLRVYLDKEQVFVGEPVRCAVRFYTHCADVTVKNIIKPPLSGFMQREKVSECTGSEQVSGKAYSYHEWSWYLVPYEEGKKIIPAFCADIEQPSSFHSLVAHMPAFMQLPGEHTRLYSDARMLMVNPLPAHEGKAVVGRLDSLSAGVDQVSAQEGEGIVYTLQFSGEGDLESLDSFALQRMPEHLKWYDSKNYMAKNKSRDTHTHDSKKNDMSNSPDSHAQDLPGNSEERQTKIFEYIVQGLAAGDYEIPAQECMYFDVHTKTFHTVHSKPVRVTIRASSPGTAATAQNMAAGAVAARVADVEHNGSAPVATSLDVTQALPLNTDGDWRVHEKRQLPWWLFGIVVCIILIFGLWRMVRYGITRVHHAYAGKNKKKEAICRAHKELYRLAQERACVGVYQLFMNVLSVLLDMPSTELHDSIIEKQLKNVGLSPEQLHAWQQFFSRAAEFSFYAPQVSSDEFEKFFKQAHAWLDLLAVHLGKEKS